MLDENHPVIRSSRRLPSGRAVLGGLLITLSVFGVLLARQLGEDATFQTVVIADQDIAPGSLLGPDNLTQARVRLDEDITTVITNPEDIYGAVLLGPADEFELIQWSNVASIPQADDADGQAQALAVVSLAVDAERVPAQLRAGELVSVLSTLELNGESTTVLIADRVTVLSYRFDDSGFSGAAVLRLGLADGELAAEIVHAAQVGEVSIIGMTGATAVDIADSTDALELGSQ